MQSYLHTFFRVPGNSKRPHLVVIPTSFSVSKPTLDRYCDNDEKILLKRYVEKHHVSLTLPYDDNIFCGRWLNHSDDAEYTHAPMERAYMLYEAVCAKTPEGHYKYSDIYMTDGSGCLMVLALLEQIVRSVGMLPNRIQNLRIYGFDDALYLLSYLGMNNICTPVYYSKGLSHLIQDVSSSCAGTCLLKSLNEAADNVQFLTGHLVPEVLWLHHSCLLSQPAHGMHTTFVISELDTPAELDLCLRLAGLLQPHVVFVLSEDVVSDVQKLFLRVIDKRIPVFGGIPVGHGKCLNHGRAVTLFSKTELSSPSGVPVLSWSEYSDFVPEL